MSASKQRVTMLDALRGAAVIGMVLHHSVESFRIVFGSDYQKYGDQLFFGDQSLETHAFAAIQLAFVAIFLLVSGICTHYSRSVIKRGVVVFSAAMLMTVVTCWILPAIGMEGLNIYFGILHMFGLSMLIYGLCSDFLQKIPSVIGFILSVVCFVLYYNFYLTEPVTDSWILLPFGVLPDDIGAYADYYPLFPFFFLFLAGTYLGKLVKAGKFPKWFYTFRIPVLEFVGRQSLWVYVFHQPVIFPIMLLIYNVL